MKLRLSLTSACAALSLTALLIGGGIVAHAQAPADGAAAPGARRAGGRGMNATAAAFKSVSPTAEEQAKFEALTATYDTDIKAAATDADPRAKRAEVNAKYQSDVEAMLTPEQRPKFKKAVVTLPILTVLDRRLMLTAEEKAKVMPILEDYAVKVDGLKGKERQAVMADMKPKIREILTPEQQTTFDSMPPNLTGGGRRGGAAPVPAAAPANP